MANPLVHFEIMGTDAAQLRAFYGKAFGWNATVEPGTDGGYAVVDNGGHLTVYVATPDIAEALRTVERLGGKTLRGPMELPNNRGSFAHFQDPAGHMIGLIQPS